MSIQYDPSVILDEAAQLYSKAKLIEGQYRWTYAMVCLGIGFCVGGAAAVVAVGEASSDFSTAVRLLITGVITLLGYIYGDKRGRRLAAGRGQELRREAQKLLCQVEIEKNTRPRLPG